MRMRQRQLENGFRYRHRLLDRRRVTYRQAAAHVERLSGNKTVAFVEEEHRRARDVVGLAHAFYRQAFDDFFGGRAVFGIALAEQFGGNRSRRDDIDGNAVAAQLQRPGARVADHSGLGRCVYAAQGFALDRAAGDKQDAAHAGVAHRRQESLRERQRRGQVQAGQMREVGLGRVGQRAGPDFSRVVNQVGHLEISGDFARDGAGCAAVREVSLVVVQVAVDVG